MRFREDAHYNTEAEDWPKSKQPHALWGIGFPLLRGLPKRNLSLGEIEIVSSVEFDTTFGHRRAPEGPSKRL